MRRLIRSACMLAVVTAAFAAPIGCATSTAMAGPHVAVSAGVFANTLTPHGEWIEVRDVGRVWRPYRRVVGVEFVPYASAGHWVYTDSGWMFESDYPWGWAAFHYGRWYDDPTYGWLWLPGDEWAPAWVEWRFGGGYVGWAPLAPSVVVVREPRWVFVEHAHFVDRDVFWHRIPAERARLAYGATVRVEERVSYGGRSFFRGPDPERIREVAHVTIPRARVTAPIAGRIEAARVERLEDQRDRAIERRHEAASADRDERREDQERIREQKRDERDEREKEKERAHARERGERGHRGKKPHGKLGRF